TGGLRSGPNAPPRDEGAGERGIREVDRYRGIQYPARPRRRHHPTISAAVLFQPIGDLRVPLAETAWRDADPDADRKEALGCGDHLSRVARHLRFLIRSTKDCHARAGLSIGLGVCSGDVMLLPCVVVSASPPT